jgi:Na+-translocating ferredoxin:NAD+ oxidoreductase RnfG subunit
MWNKVIIPGLALGPVVSLEAYAAVYMSEQQAVDTLFPGQKFNKSNLKLTSDERKRIQQLSNENVRSDTLLYYKSEDGDTVYIDRVLGKHEFITYALGVGKDGKVKGIEILEYRESYGHQVRGSEWRAQFNGKDKAAPLKLDADIKNISGATLSSAHITGGVRRILQTHDLIKDKL